MSSVHGRFVWYEMMTHDVEAAKAFYGKVAGWGARDSGMPGMRYFLWTMGAREIGGLMAIPEELRKQGVPPHWMGHIGVEDVDMAAAKAESLGGGIHRAPADIPGVGRFSILSDPGGAIFSVFKWSNGLEDFQAPVRDMAAPGDIGWNELLAGDGKREFDFYAALFGWSEARAVDIGPMGIYRVFAEGGRDLGGIFDRPAMVPKAHWLFYINVPGVEQAAERVTAGGGRILNGPMAVPTGDWIVQCMDPQGAVFALMGKKN